MKKVLELLLTMLLAFSVVMAFVACDGNKDGGEAKTKMTVELASVTEDDALVEEGAEGLAEGEKEYYVLTGYTFSDDDAAIVSKAAADKYYYTDKYTGERKDSEAYKAEKARFEALQTPVLPAEIKFVGTADKKVDITAEALEKMENGVVDLTDGATENVKSLKVRAIEGNAISGHTEITSITVPETYLYIGDSAFSGCSALEEMNLPFVGSSKGALNGAKVFGYIFGTVSYTGGVSVTQNYNASGTATYYVPENLTKVTVTAELPNYAFHNVSTLTDITYIPTAVKEGVVAIPAYAFYGTGIKDAKIASTVTEIGNGAFGNCASLMTGVAFANVTRIGDSAFENCAKLAVKENGVITVNASEYIGAKAFAGCTAIKELTVGGGATVMANAFSGLTELTAVSVDNAKLSVGAINGWNDFLTVTYTANTTVNGFDNITYAFPDGFEVAVGTQKANIQFIFA